MAASNWKSRAETVLSQFINTDESYPHNMLKSLPNEALPSYLQDNSSTNALSSCSYYDICECPDTVDSPCTSVFMAWVKLVLGRVMRVYLMNPLLLALVPLLLGVVIGFWMGRLSYTGGVEARGKNVPARQSNLWTSTTNFMMMIFMNISAYAIYVVRLLERTSNESELFVDERDETTRRELKAQESIRESGVDLQSVPRHIAVIMDGNRRYGKAKYGNPTRGHWDGSKTLIEFTKWCMAEGVQALTVYAFSTENWDRDPAEVSALMSIFCRYCEELRVEALQRGIRIHVLETESERVPSDVREGIDRMVLQTRHCDQFTMNICLSYGARGEIVNACKSLTKDVLDGTIDVDQIRETHLQKKMLTGHCCDPDVIIRTSGEERLSNFLLWQSAYSELFFLKKPWPELKKEDLVEVIRSFAQGRVRRYGK